MRVWAVLRRLERYIGRFPREALEAAIARQEEIVPHLLTIVEEAAADMDRVAAEFGY